MHRGCETPVDKASLTGPSVRKRDARQTLTGSAQRLLSVLAFRDLVGLTELHMIKVAAAHQCSGIVADRQPNLRSVCLIQSVRGARTAHPGRHPTWLECIGEHVRPSPC